MNYYLVVEGERAEVNLYANWIRYLNPSLRKIDTISEYKKNNFLILSGNGYPCYKEIIVAAMADVNENDIIDTLVIAVDSEDMSYIEKRAEIQGIIDEQELEVDVKIVVQHFCIEAWALGNRRVVSRNPQTPALKEYVDFYNVVKLDPEELPANETTGDNRAQFAKRYLKSALKEKNPRISLSPNCKEIASKQYFRQLRRRFEQTEHIKSFEDLLKAFRK